MFPVPIPVINLDDFSRCEDRRQAAEPRKSLSPIQKTDAALKESIYHAFWKDDVLRAIEYDEIDVHVKNGVVYLSGHIVNTTSQSRITNAIRSIPGILGIQNNLVLDDQLTREVAASLGNLEHTYGCKFFTGASHGVISMGGIVRDTTVKLLAEKQAARNPNVRGVINHVRVSGVNKPGWKEQPFLQPTIGETMYFLNGISGIVKQVIIDPNSRRVIAMTLQGNFTDRRYEINLLTDGKTPPPEHLIVVPMNEVRYLTRVSGFLHINSAERNRYMDFNSASFGVPNVAWVPPYPYCPADVLFPVEQLDRENHTLQQIPSSPLPVASKEQLLWEQLLANESLGG